MPDKIEPAIDAEGWAGYLKEMQEGRDFDYYEISWAEGLWRHEAAALALYGQPFGFTREDVRLIRNEVAMLIGDITEEEDAHWRSLADRIQALLPPEGAEP